MSDMPALQLRDVGLSGSLRKASFNTGLLRAAQELAPNDMSIEIASIAELPIYNEDLRMDIDFPDAVLKLRASITEADAVLIATPEYNYSVPGALKNALDWVSRGNTQPFDGKAVAIMGAAASTLGTSRAQYHLRQILVFLNAHPLNRPEVFVARANERFENGRLTDEATRTLIADQLVALKAWVDRLASAAPAGQ